MVEPGKYTTRGVPRRTGIFERAGEIARQRRDAQPGEFARQPSRRGAQGVLGDIDRHVHRRAQRADQQPALDAFAAAVLDQLAAAAGEARDRREMPRA